MNDLQNINSIFKKVDVFTSWFFDSGWKLFVTLIIIYLIINITLKVIHIVKSGEFNFLSISRMILEIFILPILRIITNIPLIVIIISICLGFFTLKSGIESIVEYQTLLKRNSELKTILKHLDREEKIAEIEVKDIKYHKDEYEIKFFITRFFRAADGTLNNEKSNEYFLTGNTLFLGTATLDFKYTDLIDNGNLAIPQILYTDTISMDNKKAINFPYLNDDNSIYFYSLNEESIYGIEEDIYKKRIKEITRMFLDKKYARSKGVISSHGRAIGYPLNNLQNGDIIVYRVLGTGGLSSPELKQVIKDKVNTEESYSENKSSIKTFFTNLLPKKN